MHEFLHDTARGAGYHHSGFGFLATLLLITVFSCLQLPARVVGAGDGNWPMWRYDVNRSAASPHELPGELHLQWKRELPSPRPAFPEDARLCPDRSYEPVAAEELLFVPSMVDDSVTAYRGTDGSVAWKFFTGGPVRFAPAYWQGKLYFGSDDGRVYCVLSGTGELVWKKRAVPDERGDYRVFGNERCISRWPVRGAPIIHDGTLFFGSGVFPWEGVYVFALDPRTGETRWVNKEIGLIDDGFNDHARSYPVGLPPLGYTAIIDNRLAVPSGRAFPAFLELDNGHLLPYTSGYGKFQSYPKGTWYVTGIGDYLLCAGHTYGLTERSLQGRPPQWVSQEDYLTYSGLPEDRVEELIKKNALRTKQIDGVRHVYTGLPKGTNPVGIGVASGHWPLLGVRPAASALKPNEEYFTKHFQILNVEPANTGMEVGAIWQRVLTKDTVYYSTLENPRKLARQRGETYRGVDGYDRIVAEDLTRSTWSITPALGRTLTLDREFIHWRYKHFTQKWSFDCPLKVHIKAGNRLYAGMSGRVAAMELPRNDQAEPCVVWEQEIMGKPYRMLASRGNLYVVTEGGVLYCFGATKQEASIHSSKPRHDSPNMEWSKVAKSHLADTEGPLRGCGLIHGWHSGGLARAIAKHSNLHVVVLEPDEGVVEEARNALSREGLYGNDIHVICSTNAEAMLPPYCAQLATSEKPVAAEPDDEAEILGQLLDRLHPYCGRAYLPCNDVQMERLKQALAKYERSEYKVSMNDDMCQVVRFPRAGLGTWTHEAASAANTWSTGDVHVKPPFGVLWFAGSIDRFFPPDWDYTHSRNPYPVEAGGRMFVIVSNTVYATDIYTGAYLWEAELPRTPKTRRRRSWHMARSRPWTENIIAGEKCVYLFDGATCYVLDAETGERKDTLTVPVQAKDEGQLAWQEVRFYDDKLYASVDGELICVEPDSKSVLWRHRAEKQRLSFAAGNGILYCVDYSSPRFANGEKSSPATLYGLDGDTGALLYRTATAMPDLNRGQRPRSTRPGPRPIVAYNRAHDIVIVTTTNRKVIRAFRGASGSLLWKTELTPEGVPGPWETASILRLEPPIVLSDQLILGRWGKVLDVQTGKVLEHNIYRGMRGCGRGVASERVLTFRDAHAAIIDLENRNKQYLQSIRAGCTNGMLPIGGILTGLNTAHGCNCNWPLFMSFSLYHMPAAASFESPSMCVSKLDENDESSSK